MDAPGAVVGGCGAAAERLWHELVSRIDLPHLARVDGMPTFEKKKLSSQEKKKRYRQESNLVS